MDCVAVVEGDDLGLAWFESCEGDLLRFVRFESSYDGLTLLGVNTNMSTHLGVSSEVVIAWDEGTLGASNPVLSTVTSDHKTNDLFFTTQLTGQRERLLHLFLPDLQ